MSRLVGICGLVALLCGCSGGYLPYASRSLDPMTLDTLVTGASQANGVPAGLVRAVVMAESAGNPSAISVAGAQGLMQLMPGTSAGCGIANPFDPTENVSCGTSFLHSLLHRYHNNVTLAVAACSPVPEDTHETYGMAAHGNRRMTPRRPDEADGPRRQRQRECFSPAWQVPPRPAAEADGRGGH